MLVAPSRLNAAHAFADRGLTGREAEVLSGVLDHLSNAEIAARLVVSDERRGLRRFGHHGCRPR